MYAGHIIEYGLTDDIFYNPKHEYTKGLIRSIPRLDAKEVRTPKYGDSRSPASSHKFPTFTTLDTGI